MPDTIVRAKAEPPEIQKAMRIGRMPIADTLPRVYLCGQCRLRRIAEEQGICRQCMTMLEHAGADEWGAVKWAIACVGTMLLMFALLLIFGIFK